MASFRSLAAFAQFGGDLDPATRRQLDRGLRLQEVLKQGQYGPWPFADQVQVLYAVTNNFADQVPVHDIKAWEEGLVKFLHGTFPDIGRAITEKRLLDADISSALDEALKTYNAQWAARA
jgi:F-type H+-transporting ATPase subunit alpha